MRYLRLIPDLFGVRLIDEHVDADPEANLLRELPDKERARVVAWGNDYSKAIHARVAAITAGEIAACAAQLRGLDIKGLELASMIARHLDTKVAVVSELPGPLLTPAQLERTRTHGFWSHCLFTALPVTSHEALAEVAPGRNIWLWAPPRTDAVDELDCVPGRGRTTCCGEACCSPTPRSAGHDANYLAQFFAGHLAGGPDAWAEAGHTVRILDGSRMRTLEAVYTELASQFSFPEYFGHNLDALWDCLTDLAWLPAGQGYVAVFTNLDELLVEARPADLVTLTRMLDDVAAYWKAASPEAEDADQPPVPFHVVLAHASSRHGCGALHRWRRASSGESLPRRGSRERSALLIAEDLLRVLSRRHHFPETFPGPFETMGPYMVFPTVDPLATQQLFGGGHLFVDPVSQRFWQTGSAKSLETYMHEDLKKFHEPLTAAPRGSWLNQAYQRRKGTRARYAWQCDHSPEFPRQLMTWTDPSGWFTITACPTHGHGYWQTAGSAAQAASDLRRSQLQPDDHYPIVGVRYDPTIHPEDDRPEDHPEHYSYYPDSYCLPVEVRMDGPVGQANLQDPAWQEGPVWRPENYWTASWGPMSNLEPHELPPSESGLNTWLKVPRGHTARVIVCEDAPPPGVPHCVYRGVLGVTNQGLGVTVGPRDATHGVPSFGSRHHGCTLAVPPGDYPVQVWVDSRIRDDVRTIVYVLKASLTSKEDGASCREENWKPFVAITERFWLGTLGDGLAMGERDYGEHPLGPDAAMWPLLPILERTTDAWDDELRNACRRAGLDPARIMDELPLNDILSCALTSGQAYWAKLAMAWVEKRGVPDSLVADLQALQTADWSTQSLRHRARALLTHRPDGPS